MMPKMFSVNQPVPSPKEVGPSCKLPSSLSCWAKRWSLPVVSSGRHGSMRPSCIKMELKFCDKPVPTLTSTWPTWPWGTRECIPAGLPGRLRAVHTLSFQHRRQFRSSVSLRVARQYFDLVGNEFLTSVYQSQDEDQLLLNVTLSPWKEIPNRL